MTVESLIKAMGPTQYTGYLCCRVEDPSKTLIHSLANLDRRTSSDPNLSLSDKQRLASVLRGKANTSELSDEQKINILFAVANRNARNKGCRIIQSMKPASLDVFYTNHEIKQHLEFGSRMMLDIWCENGEAVELRGGASQKPLNPHYLEPPSAPNAPSRETSLSDVAAFLHGDTEQKNNEARQLAIQSAIQSNKLNAISDLESQNRTAAIKLAQQRQIVQQNSEREGQLLAALAKGSGRQAPD